MLSRPPARAAIPPFQFTLPAPGTPRRAAFPWPELAETNSLPMDTLLPRGKAVGSLNARRTSWYLSF